MDAELKLQQPRRTSIQGNDNTNKPPGAEPSFWLQAFSYDSRGFTHANCIFPSFVFMCSAIHYLEAELKQRKVNYFDSEMSQIWLQAFFYSTWQPQKLCLSIKLQKSDSFQSYYETWEKNVYKQAKRQQCNKVQVKLATAFMRCGQKYIHTDVMRSQECWTQSAPAASESTFDLCFSFPLSHRFPR